MSRVADEMDDLFDEEEGESLDVLLRPRVCVRDAFRILWPCRVRALHVPPGLVCRYPLGTGKLRWLHVLILRLHRCAYGKKLPA